MLFPVCSKLDHLPLEFKVMEIVIRTGKKGKSSNENTCSDYDCLSSDLPYSESFPFTSYCAYIAGRKSLK